MKKKKPNIVYYIFIFSILGLIAYILLANSTNLPAEAVLLHKFIWGYIFFIVAFNAIGFLIIKLSQWITYYVMQAWKMVLIYSCVAMVLLVVNYSLLVTAKILVGLSNPYTFPNGGEKLFIIMWLLSLIILGLLVINQTALKNMQAQQKAALLQQENNKAKYIALQRQLNPHFLFNNLNTLIAEIEYDPANAVLFTRNLSDAYRYVLQCQDKTLISIRKELAFMNSYVFLHRVRIGDYISVECDIPSQYHDSQIPPLTLQLLMENVIKHNVISENKPMKIRINICNDLLVVSNLVNLKNNIETTRTGLNNLSNRCILLMNKDIIVEKDEYMFTVKVPIMYE
ncbi:MAG: sensor histidine kinase [Bacteroidales bacterium]